MAVLRRRTGIVSVATLSGLALTVGLAHAVAPEWSRATGLDVWNFRSADAEYQAGLRHLKDLSRAEVSMNRQIDLSDQIAAGLLDGRLSLSEAVDELEHINRDRPGFSDTLATVFPDAPGRRGQLARYAVTKALRQVPADAPARASAQARLEAGYRAMAATPDRR